MSTGRLGAGDTAIQPTIFDAKGDLLTATAGDTPARIAVGSNGQALLADSSTATGLKWGAVGKVLQVVQATYATETTVNGSTYADSGLSASITPSATSSKVLVLVDQVLHGFRAASTGVVVDSQIVRGATSIYDSMAFRFIDSGATDVDFGTRNNMVYLDSPSTTSSTTYKTQVKGSSASTVTKAQYNSKIGSITLIEIGA